MDSLQLLDAARNPLFSLYRSEYDAATGRWNEGRGAWGVTEFSGPDITPDGSFKQIPGTGTTLFVGSGELIAGKFSLRVGIAGMPERLDVLQIMREHCWAFIQARWVQHSGYDLPLARFTGLSSSQHFNPLGGAEVGAEFQPKTPYWYGPEESVPVATGVTDLEVPGEAPAPLRVTLLASQDTVNPAIRTDAGLTTWQGTLLAGQTLVIDGTPGLWVVRANGVDGRLRLTGPQPRLNPGTRAVTVTGAGLTGHVAFRPGVLAPVLTLPDIGQTAVQLARQEW